MSTEEIVTSDTVEPTDTELRNAVEEIVRTADLDSTTPNTIIASLSEKFGVDLNPRRKLIKKFINDIMEEMDNEDNAEEGGEEDEDEGNEEDDESSQPEVVERRGKKRYLIIMSDKLADFVGSRDMTRGDVVRHLWKYIRSKNLQNPQDRRQIIFDSALQGLFGVKGASMFQLSKLLNKHIKIAADIFSPQDSPKPRSSKAVRKSSVADSAAGAGDGDKSKKKSKSSGEKTSSNSDRWNICVSAPLARIVGCRQLTRGKVVKRIWAYIRRHNLQNPQDKREVKCEGDLLTIMGKPVITMFEIAKGIQNHMFPVSRMSEIDYGDFQDFYDPVADVEIGVPPDGGVSAAAVGAADEEFDELAGAEGEADTGVGNE